MYSRILTYFILFLSILGCRTSDDSSPDSVIQDDGLMELEQVKVLFIGNSHTFFNSGVDFHLRQYLAHSDIDFEPIIDKSTFGGYSLKDHLTDVATIDKLENGNWDIVVLQENSAIARDEQERVLEDMQAFQEKIVVRGSEIYLFMTWAYEDQPEMYFDIRSTYNAASQLIKAEVVPVGTAFRNIDETSEFSFYDADGIHPSPEGTFLAASMFYLSIFDKDPRINNYSAGMPDANAETIKDLAWSTLRGD